MFNIKKKTYEQHDNETINFYSYSADFCHRLLSRKVSKFAETK